MTIATQCLKEWPAPGPFKRHAARFAGMVYDSQDGMPFYIFPDGSRIGTRGTGRHFQTWEITS